MSADCRASVGISGTGFVARGIYSQLKIRDDFEIGGVLTRRPLAEVEGFDFEGLTNSPDRLIEKSDIVLECSGDAIHATEVLRRAGAAGRKLVTMNSELQITSGSWLVRKGYYLTEALGDQPGCLADLHRNALVMGFEPACYLNLKGFLNPTPGLKEMKFWADKQGLPLRQVVSFTDGTKLQIEQALVANGLGATISREGMIGGQVSSLSELDYLIDRSDEIGQALSDYVVFPGGPPGVLLLGRNSAMEELPAYLPFSRLATAAGRGYRLLRPYHLCHLEIVRTLIEVAGGAPPLLNNSPEPTITVATVAKHSLPAGYRVDQALGGFDFRGMAVRICDHPEAIPITLMHNVCLTRDVKEGQIVTTADVDLEETPAFSFYRRTLERQ